MKNFLVLSRQRYGIWPTIGVKASSPKEVAERLGAKLGGIEGHEPGLYWEARLPKDHKGIIQPGGSWNCDEEGWYIIIMELPFVEAKVGQPT